MTSPAPMSASPSPPPKMLTTNDGRGFLNTLTRITPAVVCALLLCVGGCSTRKAAGEIQVVDGCMVEVRGISIETAHELVKSWEFSDDCTVDVNSRAGKE